MTTLVFADSHTDIETMASAVDQVLPDTVIHLGDHIVDAILLRRRYPGVRFEMVAGNTDSGSHPSQKVIQLGEITAFIAHGHEYRVEEGTDRCWQPAGRPARRSCCMGTPMCRRFLRSRASC